MVAKKKKTAGGKKKKSASKNITVRYQCVGTCRAKPKAPHMNPGDQVFMEAVNIDAEVLFMRSPFRSGTKKFVIPKGTTSGPEVVKLVVSSVSFPYKLTCTNPLCATSSQPPEMIVDP